MLRLCSSSPTRAKMLEAVGVSFIVSPQDFDESFVLEKEPLKFVYQATSGKLASALHLHDNILPILCADTVVASSGAIMGKAGSQEEAEQYLLMQSGKNVTIITATMLRAKDFYLEDVSKTVYEFDVFQKEDMKAYLSSGLWQGKAGACMVEGFCKKYIKNVKGYKSTAMGLTLEAVLPFLEK